jgi:hypothetical protein
MRHAVFLLCVYSLSSGIGLTPTKIVASGTAELSGLAVGAVSTFGSTANPMAASEFASSRTKVSSCPCTTIPTFKEPNCIVDAIPIHGCSPALCRHSIICKPKLAASASCAYVITVTTRPGKPRRLSISASAVCVVSARGDNRSINCNRAKLSLTKSRCALIAIRLASAARSFAAALSLPNSAIRSCECPRSRLASAVGNSRVDVRHSVWRSSTPPDQNWTSVETTVPMAATAATVPNEISAHHETPYHQFALASVSGATGSDSKGRSLVIAISIIGAALAFAMGFLAVFFWRARMLTKASQSRNL